MRYRGIVRQGFATLGFGVVGEVGEEGVGPAHDGSLG